jgi:F-type H+-transporting ATPase subunit delta
MGPTVIARNYAETLFDLALRHGGEATVDEYLSAIDDVAGILENEPLVRDFLDTPRVSLEAKKRALEASFRGRVPDLFLRFLIVVVEKRRQAVIGEIAEQYRRLVDEARGRVRAEVVLAREVGEEFRREIVARLEQRTGKSVAAEFSVDPSLIGGVVVRIDGEVLDGSLRRRASGLRRRMIRAKLPAAGSPGDEITG